MCLFQLLDGMGTELRRFLWTCGPPGRGHVPVLLMHLHSAKTPPTEEIWATSTQRGAAAFIIQRLQPPLPHHRQWRSVRACRWHTAICNWCVDSGQRALVQVAAAGLGLHPLSFPLHLGLGGTGCLTGTLLGHDLQLPVRGLLRHARALPPHPALRQTRWCVAPLVGLLPIQIQDGRRERGPAEPDPGAAPASLPLELSVLWQTAASFSSTCAGALPQNGAPCPEPRSQSFWSLLCGHDGSR